ncbi:aminopeptidase P family protein [Globicatella sulfidifaciens]|uniref:Xaa-Pro aminopeptidase n=1 Tax=Globicatella sulfidifaciens DSM 15739 TaxID=1121925 RepID=A0A1T4LHL4_9LACT|nr:aminopeptidase P family protein [Globicatella sulfidifaciens]SJZ54180.1 Xaa-Pro aminopeptidase [Globicatella sulfidifaciens DSM 15739]
MSRVEQLRQKLTKYNAESILVTNLKNVRYLANFTGSAGVVFVTPTQQYFITDFRYNTQAAEQAKGFEIIIHKNGAFNAVAEIIEQENIQSVAIEADEMNVATYLKLKDLFDAEMIETELLLETIRSVKSEDEIKIIKEACEITDQAFEHILTFIKPGVTEIEVANELERFLKSKGASAMSFDTIVASGLRSAMPHGVASDKVIEEGDVVTLDFGCYYHGYSSDMTRTIAVGHIEPKMEEIYHIVLEAHERVNRAAKAGMTGKELDAVARDYITEKGYGPAFGHSTGHGLGLDVHEQPGINFRNEQPLLVNQVITNEPGIYVEGLGGVRIEDDLVITEDGAYGLNRSPKNLIIL